MSVELLSALSFFFGKYVYLRFSLSKFKFEQFLNILKKVGARTTDIKISLFLALKTLLVFVHNVCQVNASDVQFQTLGERFKNSIAKVLRSTWLKKHCIPRMQEMQTFFFQVHPKNAKNAHLFFPIAFLTIFKTF